MKSFWNKYPMFLMISIIVLVSLAAALCGCSGTAAIIGDPVYDGVAASSLVAGCFIDTGLAASGVLVAGTNGLITSNHDLTFSGDTLTATNLNAPTGRTADYVIAASDSPAHVKAQADAVCTGITRMIIANANSGQANVIVDNATGFGNGDVVTVSDAYSVLAESATIQSIAGNVLTMTGNLSHTYSSGNKSLVYKGSDQNTINTAIALMSNGGKLYLAAGNYAIDGPIVATKSTAIEGGGGDTQVNGNDYTTIIRAKYGMTANMMELGFRGGSEPTAFTVNNLHLWFPTHGLSGNTVSQLVLFNHVRQSYFSNLFLEGATLANYYITSDKVLLGSSISSNGVAAANTAYAALNSGTNLLVVTSGSGTTFKVLLPIGVTGTITNGTTSITPSSIPANTETTITVGPEGPGNFTLNTTGTGGIITNVTGALDTNGLPIRAGQVLYTVTQAGDFTVVLTNGQKVSASGSGGLIVTAGSTLYPGTNTLTVNGTGTLILSSPNAMQDVWFTNCAAEYSTKYGFYMDSGQYNLHLNHCYGGFSTSDAFRFFSSVFYDLWMDSCWVLNDSLANGIYLSGIRGFHINDCMIPEVGGVGIFVNNCREGDIHDNIVGSNDTSYGNPSMTFALSVGSLYDVKIHDNLLLSGSSGKLQDYGSLTRTEIYNNAGYIRTGEIRYVSKPITAGPQNTVTSIQNTFGGDVLITEAYVMLSSSASATDPTYDMGTDDDGVGAPSVGNNLFEAIPDTVSYYRSTSNSLGGGASGMQIQPILWPATGNDWVNFIITDAAGADTAGTIYITVIGK